MPPRRLRQPCRREGPRRRQSQTRACARAGATAQLRGHRARSARTSTSLRSKSACVGRAKSGASALPRGLGAPRPPTRPFWYRGARSRCVDQRRQPPCAMSSCGDRHAVIHAILLDERVAQQVAAGRRCPDVRAVPSRKHTWSRSSLRSVRRVRRSCLGGDERPAERSAECASARAMQLGVCRARVRDRRRLCLRELDSGARWPAWCERIGCVARARVPAAAVSRATLARESDGALSPRRFARRSKWASTVLGTENGRWGR